MTMASTAATGSAGLAGAGEDHPPAAPTWPSAVVERWEPATFGREADLAALRRLASGRDRAFVTLTGVGGVGKSRLAVELTLAELDGRGGRAAFVPLEGVSDASLVLPAIAGALGVADRPGPSLVDALAETLGRAPALLVLDSLERLRPAAPALSDLWSRTPGLTILATSRVALGVPGERVVRVEPLAVPGPDEHDPEALERNPSVAMFLDRARVARPELTATPANAALAAEICRRLDGIPLAIELAAAALHVLAPHQLLDQLDDRLGNVESDGSADTPGHGSAVAPDRAALEMSGRQRSLRAAMEWSLDLLPEPARRLYRRLGVMAGPFGAETAAAILDGGDRRGLLPLGIEVGAGLRQLAAASLLRVEGRGAAYSMLNTVRADALDRLARAGELVAMRWAHAYRILAVVEEAERSFPTEHEVEALDRLDEAHDDIREALEWAMEAGNGTFAVRLTGALAEFWRTRGHHTEGRLRLAAALAIAGDAPAAHRRKALAGAGLLASYQGDYRLGESYLMEALAVATSEGDDEAMAVVLNWLGTNAFGAGDLDAAERFVSDSLALRRRIGDPAGIATALNALGGVHHFRGDLDHAREIFLESLELKEALGNPSSIAVSLSNLGLVERDAGRPDAAAAAMQQAVEIWERSGDPQRLSVGLHNLALLAFDRGQYEEASALLVRSYDIARDLGDRTQVAYTMADTVRVDVERGNLEGAAAALAVALPIALALGARVIIPQALEGAGELAAARGDDRRAVRLWAAAAHDRDTSGFVNMPADQRHLDTGMARVRARLDPSAFDEAWAEGSSMGAEAAAAAAMAPGSGPDATGPDAPPV
jgi:predicted ATPase